MKPELIVFDLDGVIADTEPLHKEAKLRIMRKLGLANSVDLDRHIGRPNSELWKAVIEENGVSLTPAELERMQYDSILGQLAENGTPLSKGLPGLLDVVVSRLGLAAAVCSSSDRYYVDRVLAHFDLRERFAAVVGGDEVPQKKPAPDAYLLAVERAGSVPGRSVAIEDTAAGVASALAAGLACAGYVNPTSGRQDLTGTFMRASSLGDIADWLFSVCGFSHEL